MPLWLRDSLFFVYIYSWQIDGTKIAVRAKKRIQSPGAGLSGCRSRCGPARNGRCGRIQPWPEWPGRSPPSPGSHSCLTAGCHCSRWGMYLHFIEMWKKASFCNFWLLLNDNIKQKHIFFVRLGKLKIQLTQHKLMLATQPSYAQGQCNSDHKPTFLCDRYWV